MEQTQPRTTLMGPAAALTLAVAAAVSFETGDRVGFLTDATEAVFTLTWVVGWLLLTAAVIIGGGCAVLLGLRALSRRPVPGAEAALVAASLALVAVVVATHPLWGTGSAIAG